MKLIRFLHGVYKCCISPFLGDRCRFYPPCSDYCITCIEQHGCLKGGLLALKRFSRCHPFSSGGFDPVPDQSE